MLDGTVKLIRDLITLAVDEAEMDMQNGPGFVIRKQCRLIRGVMIGNEPWFSFNDIVPFFDLGKSVSPLPGYARMALMYDAEGRKQQTRVVNQSGIYASVLKSNTERAKALRAWLCDNVMPKIAMYNLDQE